MAVALSSSASAAAYVGSLCSCIRSLPTRQVFLYRLTRQSASRQWIVPARRLSTLSTGSCRPYAGCFRDGRLRAGRSYLLSASGDDKDDSDDTVGFRVRPHHLDADSDANTDASSINSSPAETNGQDCADSGPIGTGTVLVDSPETTDLDQLHRFDDPLPKTPATCTIDLAYFPRSNCADIIETGTVDSLETDLDQLHNSDDPLPKKLATIDLADFPRSKEVNCADSNEPIESGTVDSLETDLDQLHISDDPLPKKLATIDLADLPRSKDGGIIIYPDIHLHGKQTAHSKDKPHPQDLGDRDSNIDVAQKKEHDLRRLLYNVQKSHGKQDKVVEKRVSAMTVEELVQFLKQENAKDVCVIELPPEMDYVRYFVVCSGMGSRHIGRMADNLEAELKLVRVGREQRRVTVEGRDSEDWMAVDMGTMVVHFMLEATRQDYELEKLWTLGEKHDDQSRHMMLAAAEQEMY